jgi:hypothetical protein
MTTRTRSRIGVAVVALCLLTFASAAIAQETPGFAKNGLYVGATGVPNFAFDGVTFDGSSIYQQIGGNEILLLPRLESKSTLRSVAGYRLTRGSFEVGYERLKQTATFLGAPGEATFQTLNFDERLYAFPRKRIQPHGLAGYFTAVAGVGRKLDRVGRRTYHVMVSIWGGAVYPHPRIGISTGYRTRDVVHYGDRTNTTYELLRAVTPAASPSAPSLCFAEGSPRLCTVARSASLPRLLVARSRRSSLRASPGLPYVHSLAQTTQHDHGVDRIEIWQRQDHVGIARLEVHGTPAVEQRR